MTKGIKRKSEKPKDTKSIEDTILDLEQRIQVLKDDTNQEDAPAQIEKLEKERTALQKKMYSNLTPYEIVKIARHHLRPPFSDHLKLIVDDFIELHGDRNFGDDNAIVTGFGTIGGKKALIIGQHKGKTTKERIESNFGMPNRKDTEKHYRK